MGVRMCVRMRNYSYRIAVHLLWNDLQNIAVSQQINYSETYLKGVIFCPKI